VYTFGWHEEAWRLIQVVKGTYFSGDTLPENADETVYDLINGAVTQWTTNAAGERVSESEDRPIKPFIALENFSIHREAEQW
jgi:hypothetical protein